MSKRQVEVLLATFDADPVGALTVALQAVTGRADAPWEELVHVAAASPQHVAALLARQQPALDSLAAELNELRTLDAKRLAHEAEQTLHDA